MSFDYWSKRRMQYFLEKLKGKLDLKINTNDIVDNLTSTDTDRPLSAKQGKVLDEKIDGLYTESTDNEPYVLRQGKGDMVDMELVGGSFAWNQLVNFSTDTYTRESGVVVTRNSNGSIRFVSDGTNTKDDALFLTQYSSFVNLGFGNHKILLIPNTNTEIAGFVQKCFISESGSWTGSREIIGALPINKASVVSIPSGYNYFTWYSSMSANITCDVTLKPQIIDLTTLFGSTTIADAIYAMEQATSGSGVAFFRKYFPNDYYAYDTGSIQSVNVASRKVVGKNLLNLKLSKLKASNTSGTWSGNTYTFRNATFAVNTKANGEDVESITMSSTASSSVGYLTVATNINPSDCVVGGKYIISSDNSDINVSYYNGSDVEGGDTSSLEFVYNPSTIYWNVVIRASSQTISNKIARPMIRDARITDATYAPYKDSISYPFDTTTQLRGIPSLVNNKLVYDGDVLKSDGSITRKYGIVNLGSLTWTYDYTFSHMVCSNIGFNIGSKEGLLCAKYTTQSITSWGQLNDKCIARHPSDAYIIRVYDSAYTDPTTFKTAMNGVYLVYELATPTIESAESYQNPQRSDANGTEEFIDFGVSAGTRDVSIPVGHNSTYKSSEVIQPLEDYVDGVSADLDNKVQEKVAKTDIADNLTTNDATKVLSAKQGKALQDGKINVYDIGSSVFEVVRGNSINTSRPKYWAAMSNTTGPTTGKWWHVLNMDWDDRTNNWVSQLALATQDGSGIWWRRNNSSNTEIIVSTWHRLAEGDADGNAIGVDKLYATGSFTSSTTDATTITATNSNISISSTTVVEVCADIYGYPCSDVSVSGSGTSATVTVVFPKDTTARTVNYRIYIKTI